MKNLIEYFTIIINRRNNPLPKGTYSECHHIYPKSCGGTDDRFNLVRLTPEEHYRCHELLPLIFKDIDEESYSKMLFAWNYMTGINNGKFANAALYGELKREFSEMKSKSQSGENNPFFGKTHTDETKKIIGEKSSQRVLTPEQHKHLSDAMSGENNPRYGVKLSEETKEKIRLSNTGKHRMTVESRKRQSDRMKGEHNPFFGKTHTDEVRAKISLAHRGKKRSASAVEKTRQKLIGRKFRPETLQRMSEARKRYWERKKSQSI